MKRLKGSTIIRLWGSPASTGTSSISFGYSFIPCFTSLTGTHKSSRTNQKLLFAIWIVLLGLLLLTWFVVEFDPGKWNIVVVMTIAVAKMLLVVLIFMHAHYNTKLAWVFAAAGFFWLFLMVTLTMGDYLTRGSLDFHW